MFYMIQFNLNMSTSITPKTVLTAGLVTGGKLVNIVPEAPKSATAKKTSFWRRLFIKK